MNCLTALSETVRHGGASNALLASPNLFPAGRDALGGFSASRIVLVGGGIAVPFVFQSFHRQDI